MFLLRRYLILVFLLLNISFAQDTIPPRPSVKAREQNATRDAWFRRGRTLPSQSSAGLRFQAYQQKLLMRNQALKPRTQTRLTAADVLPKIWQALGPAPL